MEDERIIDLYWRRDERAIAETSDKYGAYCHAISMNILSVREDAAYALGHFFSRGTRERLKADDTKQQELIEQGMATTFDAVDDSMSVTVEGVCI